ncbi:MAG: TPM domain-containing protein [Chthoniobacterales bacterium]
MFAVVSSALAAVDLPPAPADYVLDEAGVLDAGQRTLLSHDLKQFERETSNQLVVAVIPRVPDGEVMEDYTQRVAESWGAGRKDRDNGMVLFVFPESRQLRIEVGYGLEGAVPDILANRIINDDIVPSFRAGDVGGGIVRGADALMAAARGEYSGSGQTLAEQQAAQGDPAATIVFWIVLIIILIIVMQRSHGNGGTVYTPRGRRDVFFPGGFGGGVGFGGGGFGGGGGFSGGGGGFGGGGASGRW